MGLSWLCTGAKTGDAATLVLRLPWFWPTLETVLRLDWPLAAHALEMVPHLELRKAP